jgi:DHA1 family bicyclomycin/chloramphenicol resistance-like MFS transporter
MAKKVIQWPPKLPVFMSKELKSLFLIVVIFIAACIETDIYLPAFPDMMAWFSVSEGAIQGLLTWNFVGICVSSPLYGPLADAFGRKKPLLAALGMFLCGSIITIFATSLEQMLWGRIFQGLGSGGCFTLGTAIIFDVFQKEKAIQALNKLNMIIPVIMAGAPMLGGALNHAFGFRSNFLTIAIFVTISLIVSLVSFEETLPKEKRIPLKVSSIVKDFKEVFCCLPFWQLTLTICLIFSAYIAFLSGTSVLFVVEFGMSKTVFPFVQAAILGGWLLGSLLLSRSMAKRGIGKVKKIGTLFCLMGGLELLLATLITPRDPYLLTLGMTLYAFGANWVIGLYFPESMELLPHTKGIAASLITSARLLSAALIVGLTSALYNSTIYPLTAVVVGSLVIMLPLLVLYEKRKAAWSPS